MDNSSLKIGFGFGLASGVITTLGLMVGLFASTYSRGIVLSGILTIAIADSCSDAVGIHFSQESKGHVSVKNIWLATLFTFLSKLFVTLSFIPTILFIPLKIAIIVNIFWGFFLLSLFSYIMAVRQKNNPYHAILEHVFITIVVIIATYYLGSFIEKSLISN